MPREPLLSSLFWMILVIMVPLSKKTRADRIVALFNQTLCACLLQVCENENSHPSTQGQVFVSREGSADMKRNTVPDMILGWSDDS